MAATPKYKVYKGQEYIGCVKYAEDAAALVSIQSEGTVRIGHKRILWTEGIDGNAGDSYDEAAAVIHRREADRNGS